ncbi:ribose-5-phosphate isomerase RpiA [Paenibacillus sp. IB182496]|uniref:Ribose-5-phosphate isomerase A n=1 Tax=Paenibacillus sabuli TaxID=2772509 RepID=A0A927BRG7_9BACL|nr:ribose-5-phosphate isomerase RpiA [Paenibacillus sabuli]MBD2844194.1 ribose-5-phosphate isomerase RpiA [Paenibacillus sabuli]
MQAKRMAAERAAQLVKDGMAVGLGTGSTATLAIRALADRVAGGLRIRATATSERSAQMAMQWGIPLVSLEELERLDLTIDGADEVDPQWCLIKGGGGALLREKIVASASAQFIVIVDASKLVTRLGAFPLPVEVTPFGHVQTLRRLGALGCDAALREQEGQLYRTDNGHYIADCRFADGIAQPAELELRLNAIPGVVDNGLFVGMASRIIVGHEEGAEELVR